MEAENPVSSVLGKHKRGRLWETSVLNNDGVDARLPWTMTAICMYTFRLSHRLCFFPLSLPFQ